MDDNPMMSSLPHHMLQVEMLAQEADEYDVIHSHLDFLPFSQFRSEVIPAVTTLHGRLDMPDLMPIFREFDEMRLVSISDAQRAPMPWANWLATVYHGLPEDLYRMHEGEGKYLAFLGRISPEKRLDRAIEIANRVGMTLRIAAKVDAADQKYFDTHIRKLLDGPNIEFIGEVDDSEKGEFLGNAAGLLFPIDWPEPFGLVMIEAMACGTPVIAFPGGSVAEILEHGVTGYVVKNVKAAADATSRIPLLSRKMCRAVFEERFSARRMCQDYVSVYERVATKAAKAA
jgi:glycosyltransferase involved in cell wall biosynthesis